MDSGASQVLRPYQRPREDLSFIATAPHANATSASGGGSVYVPRTPTNRYLSADADAALLTMQSNKTTVGAMVTGMLVSGALQYTSTCMAMPFEVGKLLLQVQWVPREDVWQRMRVPSTSLHKRRKRSQSEVEQDPWSEAPVDDEDDEPSKYFRDTTDDAAHEPRRRVDEGGYVVPERRDDTSTRPEFMMPVVVKGGVMEMIRAVVRGKEGWMGLWKGALTTFLLDLSTLVVQPILTGILSIFAPSALNPMPIAFSPQPIKTLTLLMTTRLLTGFLVSPLDLVRTRLIAQSMLPQHRKYHGPIDALRTILREEGGWRTAYLHPNLLIPTLLDYFFRPLFSLGAPLVIENVLHLDPSAFPISYALAEFVVSTLSLGITLPIETARRRLQLQYHEPLRTDHVGGLLSAPNANTARRGLRTCVETRPVPYSGVAETIYRILTEETTTAPGKVAASDDGSDDEAPPLAAYTHSRLSGVRGLYRGLGMGFSANLLVFVLTLLTGERQTQSGWTEL